jgi:hypothetical protein
MTIMKIYRASRTYRWSTTAAKIILTAVGGLLYFLAVTQPTTLGVRLLLLAGLTLFGWLFYVRLPKTPTEVIVTDDGYLNFRSRRGTTRVPATTIRSIRRGFGRRNLYVQHAGGEVRVPNRFKKLVDLLLTVKGLNPAVEMRGF